MPYCYIRLFAACGAVGTRSGRASKRSLTVHAGTSPGTAGVYPAVPQSLIIYCQLPAKINAGILYVLRAHNRCTKYFEYMSSYYDRDIGRRHGTT